MKLENKFRRGSVVIAVTAAVIVAVLLLNVGLTAVVSGNLLFSDLTADSAYKLNRETTDLLDQTFESVRAEREATGERAAEVEIIFCSDPDLLKSNRLMRYVYYTARSLAKKYPKVIRVRTVDVWSNPSVVDAYRTNSYSSIYQSNVIVASGSEFRILSLRNFYTYSSDTDTEPWAYSGERIFTRTIMAVTKAEAPICGITVNHGEPFGEEHTDADGNPTYQGLLNTVKGAGFKIQYLNLETQEIPADCRLILVFDPQEDFKSGSYLSGTAGEIGKLDRFLDDANSLMVFVDADTPHLPVFEEFLGYWGIAFERYVDPDDELTVLGNYRVVSARDSVDSENRSVIGAYETAGTGGSVTSSIRASGTAPKVIFPNSMPIVYSSQYLPSSHIPTEEDSTDPYDYGYYYKNGHERSIYNVFRASEAARGTYAEAIRLGGEAINDGEGNPIVDSAGSYQLATVTSESRLIGEGQGYTNVNDATYVCAFGSTAFAGNDLLLTNSYGNTDVLLQILRVVGHEVVGVGLKFEPMYETEIADGYVSQTFKTAWTVVLALIPALTATGLGVWVLVRRRFGH